MNLIRIEEIMKMSKEELEKMNFHFCWIKDIESINEKGLEARLDANSGGVHGNEKTKKVFFSQGLEYMLMMVNRAFNIVMSDIKNKSEKGIAEIGLLNSYTKLKDVFSTNEFEIDTISDETKKSFFELISKAMEARIYYICQLNGCTRDEFKQLSPEDQIKIDYFRDDINEESLDEEKLRTVEKSNMHTISGKGIAANKISRIVGNNNQTLSQLDIVVKLCEKYRELYPEKKFPVRLHGNNENSWYDTNWLEEYYFQYKKKEIFQEYQYMLSSISPEAIDSALKVLDIRRKTMGKSIGHENLDGETQNVFELMEKYKESIKQLFISSQKSITHISSVAPEMLRGGKISKSINRANNYETEYGDWVFASSSEINGNNPYIARNARDGMVLFSKNAYIYGGDNMEVTTSENGDKRVTLKQPNYIYHINPQNFTPVTTLKKDKEGMPYFDFSEEWISEQEVDINDPRQVSSVDTLTDITSILQNFQILCDVNREGIAREIRSSDTREQAMKKLYERIQDGTLRYINSEVGINVNPEFAKQRQIIFSERKIGKATVERPIINVINAENRLKSDRDEQRQDENVKDID